MHSIRQCNEQLLSSRLARQTDPQQVRDQIAEWGRDAVCVLFSDIEGKLHILVYDRDFVLEHFDNLTFDGSSIRGFTNQCESDFRLEIDWSSLYYPPEWLFGPKLLVFGLINKGDGSPFECDFRGELKRYLAMLHHNRNLTVNVAAEIEGFLFEGVDVEREYDEDVGFKLATRGGYFNTLPGSALRLFIDSTASVQRAMAFGNEKDHPEVAPSQFELNWKYTEALDAADKILLYKLISRQVAMKQGKTASFLPKPVAGINGSGMHMNISMSSPDGNTFATPQGTLSQAGTEFAKNVMRYARDICLALNSSVNSYRRLDPAFEAPNEIKMSSVDRGVMVRIPAGNVRSARIEVRSVAPDANPYLAIYALLRAGIGDYESQPVSMEGVLPATISEALDDFNDSEFVSEIMGEPAKSKFIEWKTAAADRCPRKLGNTVKRGEIIYR